jgi:hypothetical protein
MLQGVARLRSVVRAQENLLFAESCSGSGQASEGKPLKLIIDSSILLVLAGGLGLGLLSLLLTILAGGDILRGGSFFDIALHSLAVDTFNIRVRRGNTSTEVLVPTLGGLLHIVALLINNACLCFILSLELNLALEGLHLLGVKEVTILVAILDLLFLSNNTMLHMGLVRGGRGSGNDSFLLLLNHRDLLFRLFLLGC